MKNLLMIALMLILASCLSREKKANQLIKAQFFKTIANDFSSYQPIETTLDSAFTTIYRDTAVLTSAIRVRQNLDSVHKYIKLNKVTCEKCREYLDKEEPVMVSHYLSLADSYYKLGVYYLKEVRKNQIFIRGKARVFHPEFLGWRASHRFRCNSKGTYQIYHYSFLFNGNISQILNYEQIRDADQDKLSLESIINKSVASPITIPAILDTTTMKTKIIVKPLDLSEFNWYIKGKVYQSGPRKGEPFIPSLRAQFLSDSDYEDFIVEYEQKLLNPSHN